VAILSRGYRSANGTSDEIELVSSVSRITSPSAGKESLGPGSTPQKRNKRSTFFSWTTDSSICKLARDIDIVLLDASREMARNVSFPQDVLRTPFRTQPRQISSCLPASKMRGAREAIQRLGRFPVFASETRLLRFPLVRGDRTLLPQIPSALVPSSHFAESEIPRPSFAISRAGMCPSPAQEKFRDHHRYVPEDIALPRASCFTSKREGLFLRRKRCRKISLALPFHQSRFTFP